MTQGHGVGAIRVLPSEPGDAGRAVDDGRGPQIEAGGLGGATAEGDLVAAVRRARGCSTEDAARLVGGLLAAPSGPRAVPREPEPGPLSPETLRRNRARLVPGAAAGRHLEGRGLDPEALTARFGVGLAAPAERDGAPSGAWLAAPVMGPDGVLRKRMVKIAVPGVSPGARGERSWCTGAPLAYWDRPVEDRPWLLVAGEIEELWRLAQVVQGTSLAARLAIVASTHDGEVPRAWKDQAFWARWEQVFLGHGNDEAGERAAAGLRRLARREVLRAEPPRDLGRGWLDMFAAKNGRRNARDLEWRLDAARPMGAVLPEAAPPAPLAE